VEAAEAVDRQELVEDKDLRDQQGLSVHREILDLKARKDLSDLKDIKDRVGDLVGQDRKGHRDLKGQVEEQDRKDRKGRKGRMLESLLTQIQQITVLSLQ